MSTAAGPAGRAAAPAGNGGGTVPATLRRQARSAIVQDTDGAAGVWRAELIALPEIAGTVVAARPEVTRFAAGNEVFGISRGSLSA